MESGRKSYDRFHLPDFSIGANPVRNEIFTGRAVLGRRRWAVHREAGFVPAALGYTSAGPALVPGLHRKPVQNMIPVQVQRSQGCAPGGPAQSPARPTFDWFLAKICPPTALFRFAIKGASSPTVWVSSWVFLSIFSTSIVVSLELASSPFPPMILAYF
jgi:hypothetical protein